MSKRTLLISLEAKSDLKSILKYSQINWGSMTAQKYLSYIRQQLKLLKSHERIGNQHPELNKGIRSLPCRSHVIYYRINQRFIEVIRILHSSQEPNIHILK